MGQSNSDPYFKNLGATAPITASHKIITGFDSSAVVEFGETFKVFANSSLRLAKVGQLYKIHLISGQVEREKVTGRTEFLVENVKSDEKTLKVGEGQSLSQLTHLELPETLEKKAQPTKEQSLLAETFRLHQRFIEKCFIKHYERKKGQTQSGVLMVHFDVSKKGKLSNVEIKNSQFKDPDFDSCVADVVERVKIRYYAGESKRVQFPIQVTLPF